MGSDALEGCSRQRGLQKKNEAKVFYIYPERSKLNVDAFLTTDGFLLKKQKASMGTIMDIGVKQRGFDALVDAARSITLFNREPFNYTIKKKIESKGLEQVSSVAMACKKNKINMNNVKKSAIFSGLVYAAFMGCYYGFTENTHTAIILTVFNWLFFTLFMYLLGNSKYMKKITAMDFGNGAPMIISSGANHFSGRIAVGGRLFLFNDMLQFKPHKFNFYRNETQIALRDVNAVEFYDILGLFRTGMKITAVNGNVEKFVVENREIWKSKILEAQKQSA